MAAEAYLGGNVTTGFADRYGPLAGLPFEGGYPSETAATALEEKLFFERATQVYLGALPAMSMWAIKQGLEAISGTGYGVMSVFELFDNRYRPGNFVKTEH